MTHEEAQKEADRLSAESPDRERFHWFAKQTDGQFWTVVRVARPPGMRIDPLKATTEAKPEPQHAEDPRSASNRNLPGTGY